MAVMKTFCGCMSTKSGTMAVLLIYTVLYIGGIVYYSISLSNDDLKTYINKEIVEKDHDCSTGEHKDSWWCKAIVDVREGIESIQIAGIVILAVFLICSILAIFGTAKERVWFMMPWIVIEFISLLLITLLMVMVVILMSVYQPEDGDASEAIAVGVIVAAIMAFLFYLWLCVVSHFQMLREVAKLGLSTMDNVQKFTNEEDCDSIVVTGQVDLDDNYEPDKLHSMEYSPEKKPTDNPLTVDSNSIENY